LALSKNPNATETNPTLQPFANNLAALAVVDSAIWMTASYGLWRMAETYPRRATIQAIGLLALEVAIGWHNLAIANRRP
jgi:hypothetical protein